MHSTCYWLKTLTLPCLTFEVRLGCQNRWYQMTLQYLHISNQFLKENVSFGQDVFIYSLSTLLWKLLMWCICYCCTVIFVCMRPSVQHLFAQNTFLFCNNIIYCITRVTDLSERVKHSPLCFVTTPCINICWGKLIKSLIIITLRPLKYTDM